jgi:hypothetical protein
MKYHSELREVAHGRLDSFPVGSIVRTVGGGDTLYHILSKSTGMVHLLAPEQHINSSIIVPGYRHAVRYRVVKEKELPLFAQGELF